MVPLPVRVVEAVLALRRCSESVSRCPLADSAEATPSHVYCEANSEVVQERLTNKLSKRAYVLKECLAVALGARQSPALVSETASARFVFSFKEGFNGFTS